MAQNTVFTLGPESHQAQSPYAHRELWAIPESFGSAYPTLSAAELINLTQTQATPRVTITVP